MIDTEDAQFELISRGGVKEETAGDAVTESAATVKQELEPRVEPLTGNASAQAGVASLGLGLYKARKILAGGGVVRRIGSDKDVKTVYCGEGNIQEGLSAIRQDVQTVLDNQSFLVALLSEGKEESRTRFGNMELQEKRSFESILDSVQSEAAKRDVREFKINMDAAMKAYVMIIRDMEAHAEAGEHPYPSYVKEDAKEAKRSATLLYMWAKTYVPKCTTDETTADKGKKLSKLPYILAMALAVRIEMDACLLEGDMMDSQTDTKLFETRSQEIVIDFVNLLSDTLSELLTSTSLLEVALDFDFYISTYISLIRGFRASLKPLDYILPKLSEIFDWDDGLAVLRDVFYKVSDADDDAVDCRVEFSNLEESLWWVKFTDNDTRAIKHTHLTSGVDVETLCQVLGTSQIGHETLRIHSEKKKGLLELPSASSLRRNFQEKLESIFTTADLGEATLKMEHIANTRTLKLLEASSWKKDSISIKFTNHCRDVKCVVVTPDGKRAISGGHDNFIRVWCLRTGDEKLKIGGHLGAVKCLAVTPDSKRVISGSKDSSVRVCCLQSGACERVLSGHLGEVRRVVVSPDGEKIVSSDLSGFIKIWNLNTGKNETTLRGHNKGVTTVAITRDGSEIVSGGADRTIKVWSIDTGEMLSVFPIGSPVRYIAPLPDGKRVIVGAWDHMVRTVRLKTGVVEDCFDGKVTWIHTISVSSDGSRAVLSGQSKIVRIWNILSNKEEGFLEGHGHIAHGAVFTPDDNKILTCSGDGSVRVWG